MNVNPKRCVYVVSVPSGSCHTGLAPAQNSGTVSSVTGLIPTHTRTHATRTELNLERLLLLLFINSIIKVAVTNTIVLSLHVLGN